MVLVLSANDDTKVVMKGITHGAVDYLLKPVRIEQLKNIWQHVIRRKRIDSRDQNNVDSRDKCRQGLGEGGQGSNEAGHSDHGKLNKKRKDQNEDDDEENDENGHDNEDPSTQKKPRVVWSVELHRKFVAAVNQLGIDSMFFFGDAYPLLFFIYSSFLVLSNFLMSNAAKSSSDLLTVKDGFQFLKTLNCSVRSFKFVIEIPEIFLNHIMIPV